MKRRFAKVSGIFALSLTGLMSVGCTSEPVVERSSMQDMKWVLQTMNNVAPEVTGVSLTFNAANNRITGFAGCNRFFGRYQINGNNIVISDVATTRKFCPDGSAMATERQFLEDLKRVRSYEMRDGRMVLGGLEFNRG